MLRYREIPFAFRASLIFLAGRGEGRRGARSSSTASFALCSLLFDLSRFNAWWIFQHSGGWSSTSWSNSPLSLSLSLRGYANSLEALRESSFLSRETSDRFFSFFPSSFLQVDFRRGIVTSEKSSIDRFTSYHFCRNLARTFRSSRRFRRVHEHRRSINAGVSKHGKPTNRIPSPRRQENFYDYR